MSIQLVSIPVDASASVVAEPTTDEASGSAVVSGGTGAIGAAPAQAARKGNASEADIRRRRLRMGRRR